MIDHADYLLATGDWLIARRNLLRERASPVAYREVVNPLRQQLRAIETAERVPLIVAPLRAIAAADAGVTIPLVALTAAFVDEMESRERSRIKPK